MPLTAQYRRIFQGEIDPYAGDLDLPDPHPSCWYFCIRSYEQGKTVTETGLHSHGKVHGGEQVILFARFLFFIKRPASLHTEIVKIVLTVLTRQQIGRGSSADEESGVAAQVKIIAQVQRDLQHIE